MVRLPREPRVNQSTKVLERALAVLDCFTENDPERSTTEVAAVVGLPVSTTYRIVNALEAQGLLRPVGGGRFRLGAAAVSLGHRAAAGFDLRRDLHGRLEQVAERTRETALLSVFEPRRPGCSVHRSGGGSPAAAALARDRHGRAAARRGDVQGAARIPG